MKDHEPLTLREFLGTFDRGDVESVPPGYFRDSRNVRFITGGVKTRFGTTLDITIGSVKRMAVYKRIGEAQRLLLLDNTGKLWDSSNLGAPILNIAGMTDFSLEVMFNRAFISPHNGQTGLPGEKVYVYEGSGTARAAAGGGPTGFTLGVVDSATSGNVEKGTRFFGVAYESSSGFITKPGGFFKHTAVGGKAADISSIPVGPAWVIARHILVTRDLVDATTTDSENQEYFFVPNGRIPNNVATTYTVSFYDADLVSSGDYLLDELSEIPAGVGLRNYGGRLVVWGEDASPSIGRCSRVGEPESHDAVEGYFTANPGDSGGGIRNVAEYRTQLLIFKSERALITKDNGENAAFWEVDDLDPSVGTECHGLGQIRDYGDNLQDRVVIAARTGLQLFNGTFSEAEISSNISEIWNRITDAHFHKIEVVIDPVEALVYITVPLDGATDPSHLLVVDYQDGFEKIKWTIWTFPNSPQTIVVDVDNTTKTSIFKFGAVAGNVYKLDLAATNDYGTAIDHWVHFPHFPQGDDGKIWHFTGVRMRIKGTGNLDISVSGEDDASTINAPSVVLATAPGREYFQGFDFTNERASVKLRMDSINEKMSLTKFVLFHKIEAEERLE